MRLFIATILLIFTLAVFTFAERDISKLSPSHAKIVLSLMQNAASRSNATCTKLFEPGPQDHCCTVWDNIDCAEDIYKCVGTCEQGVENCIQCLGPAWVSCCCCIQNLGVKISCPQCC